MLGDEQRRGLIREDVDTGITAAQILAMFDGVQLQWLLDPDAVDLVATLADYLCDLQTRLAPPSAEYGRTGNALLNRLFGATLHDVPWNGDRNGAIRDLAARLQAEGRMTYVVPYGASNPLGAVGYASTVTEIAGQCAALGFVPGAIAQCSGSAGTQAGLVVGARV